MLRGAQRQADGLRRSASARPGAAGCRPSRSRRRGRRAGRRQHVIGEEVDLPLGAHRGRRDCRRRRPQSRRIHHRRARATARRSRSRRRSATEPLRRTRRSGDAAASGDVRLRGVGAVGRPEQIGPTLRRRTFLQDHPIERVLAQPEERPRRRRSSARTSAPCPRRQARGREPRRPKGQAPGPEGPPVVVGVIEEAFELEMRLPAEHELGQRGGHRFGKDVDANQLRRGAAPGAAPFVSDVVETNELQPEAAARRAATRRSARRTRGRRRPSRRRRADPTRGARSPRCR